MRPDLSWEVLGRAANRARPFVRLVDSRGRRWGQAETTVYPSSSWRPASGWSGWRAWTSTTRCRRASIASTSASPLGSGQDRLAESGPWGVAGRRRPRAGPSAGEPVDAARAQMPRRSAQLDATFDGVRLLGASLDRDGLRAGERVRLSLFWQNAAGRLDDAAGHDRLRDARRAVLCEWRGVPVDGTYPTTDWKPVRAGPRHLGSGAAGAAARAGRSSLQSGWRRSGGPSAQHVRVWGAHGPAGSTATPCPPSWRPAGGAVRAAGSSLSACRLEGAARPRPGDTA